MKKNRLQFVRNLLKDILDNISTHPLRPYNFSYFWYQKEEGCLFLKHEEIEKYRTVRNKLLQKSSENKKEDLSESALDSALKNTVFECVDIPKRRDDDPEVRLDNALEKLQEFLSRHPEQYECYIEVGGIDTSSLPSSFGDIRFVIFNEYQIGRLKKTIRTKCSKDWLKTVNMALGPLSNHPLAVVKVNARDSQAAKKLAERKIRTTIECLNFFSGIIAKNSTLFLPTEPCSNSIRGFSVAKSGLINIFDMFTDIATNPGSPTAGFSLKELRRSPDSMVRRGTRHLGSLLKKENKNKVEEVTLRAVYWGGRATAEETPEESFLFFIVALECLILPKNSQELNYRLSQRIAQLLGRSTRERRNLMEKIKELYGIRSKIVHSGHYEVNGEQYAEIYNIAKSTILKLLANRHLREFNELNDFENWLKDLSL